MIFRFSTAFVACLFLPTLSLEAQEVQKWNCLVEDFKGFSDKDQRFIEANMKKKFTLFVTPTEVSVKTESDRYDDSEKRFTFFATDSLARHGMAESVISLETISIASDPQRLINERGYFQTTITIQSNILANSWLLRCFE